jgi:hypothetical protein
MAAESFVRVTHDGGLVDEYPLPLPMLPTYREMNLIKKVTGLTIGAIILGIGDDPDADFAVAVYAIKRANPEFGIEEAQALFDVPFGGIEIHFGEPDPEQEGGSPEVPRPESRADEPEHEPSNESPES